MRRIAVFIAAEWAERCWWMNLIFLFCLYMTFVYMPFDLFLKPVADAKEVWLGFTLHGWWAKATEMWPWAAIYVGQVAVAMFLWNVIAPGGSGWIAGAIAGAVFLVPTIALLRSRSAFLE